MLLIVHGRGFKVDTLQLLVKTSQSYSEIPILVELQV